jgi:Tfp pilus assembly protein PilO
MKPAFLLGAMGIALAGLIGYNTVYVPQQQQMGLIRAQIAQEQANQQTAAEGLAQLQEIERYRTHLPPEPNPSWLARELVVLAQRSGVQLTTITQGAPQESGQFTHLTVNVQFTASYHQLGMFLDDLERSDRFIRVDRINVSRPTPEERPSIQLACSTVYLPPVLSGSASWSQAP